MKRLIIFLLPLICFSCLESDYYETPLVSFVGQNGEIVDPYTLSTTTVELLTTGPLEENSVVVISVSDIKGVVTNPPADVFTGDIQLAMSAGDSSGYFEIDYVDTELLGSKDIFFTIEEVQGSIASVGNGRFTLRAQGDFIEFPEIDEAVSIEESKSQVGSSVTVVGVMNSPDLGFTYNGGASQLSLFTLQDESGGVNILRFEGLEEFQRGDILQIEGEIEISTHENSDQRYQITGPDNVTKLGTAADVLLEPIEITESDLTVDSKYQGQLVTIKQVTLDDASQWNFDGNPFDISVTATVGSTSFLIEIDDVSGAYGVAAPTGSFTLSGVLNRLGDDVQILPFLATDVVSE
ncbi:DUF5689 domain-containing protein [Reichenbachiella versicolor]|uniref:DUF5689 domain-containing protein n=1 Tax=Reichenbachiella versicolor TaxID=1821036 RepID=UPI0013A56248|nr:DUF5689 domain-containing protein [Reichenbachiella versicolor]